MARKTYEHICDCCGKIHFITSSQMCRIKDGRQKTCYCSKECMGKMKHTGYDIECSNCHKLFYRRQYLIDRNQENQFCCTECEFEFKYKKTHEFRICETCKKEFECLKSSTQRFCCNKCQSIWQTAQKGKLNCRFTQDLVQCNYCGKDFYVKHYKTISGQALLCSKECRCNWYKNVLCKDNDYIDNKRIKAVNALKNRPQTTFTLPQQITNDLLNQLNINYVNEESFKYYAVDNYLNENNLIIEVMGDYWHSNPLKYNLNNINQMQQNRLIKDKAKHSFILNQYGINILYLWESDLYNNKDLCKNLIKLYVDNNGKLNNYHSYNWLQGEKLKLKDDIIQIY